MDDAEKIRQAQNKLFKGIMKELLKLTGSTLKLMSDCQNC